MLRIFIIAALLLGNISAFSLTVDVIINKHLNALGYENFDKIKTMYVEGEQIVDETPLAYKLYYKMPNQIRSESTIQGKLYIEAFDGKIGWYSRPLESGETEYHELPSQMYEQLKQKKNFVESPLAQYKEMGVDISFDGREVIDGANMYKLKINEKAGRTIFIFLNPDTYLIHKILIEAPGPASGKRLNVEVYMKDYRKKKSIQIPFVTEMFYNGALKRKIVLTKVIMDKKLPKGYFSMPK